MLKNAGFNNTDYRHILILYVHMTVSKYELILVEPNGNYAIPDIIITSEFENAFSIQNIADIAQRKDNLSKNITFPGTKKNDQIFNSLYSFNRQVNDSLTETLFYNYSPVRGVRCTLFENGYPIFKGDLKINDISKDKDSGVFTYVGLVTGQAISFFGKIQDKLLTDLDFSESVPFTFENIQSSWAYDDSKDYVIPMIDFGAGKTPDKTKFDVRNLRPAIYVREYVKRILLSQGYTYRSEFMETDAFKRAYIPYTEKELAEIVFGNYIDATGGNVFYPILRDNDAIDIGGVTFNNYAANQYVSKNNINVTGFNTTGGGDFEGTTDVFQFTRQTSTAVRLELNFTVASSGGQVIYSIMILPVSPDNKIDIDNGMLAQTETFQMNGNTSQTRNITLEIPYRDYDKGYRFCVGAIVAQAPQSQQADYTQLSSRVTFGNTDAATGSSFAVELGDTIPLKSVIPKEQKAVDFLKSILTFFNIYMMENPENDKEFIMEDYNTFYKRSLSPVGNAIAWEIDDSSIHIKINTSLPRTYNFKFKEDSDFYNTLYRNTYNNTYGNYSIDNSNGSAEPKSVEVVFSPTVVVLENGDDKILPAVFSGSLTEKESYKSNLRILYNNGIKPCAAYNVVQDGETKVSNVATYNVSHHTLEIDGLSVVSLLFGLPLAVYYPVTAGVFEVPTLFDLVFKNQLVELNDPNIFTVEVAAMLREVDINKLDLRIPVFVSTSQGYAYFKILSVTYYGNNQASPVVMQKIIL